MGVWGMRPSEFWALHPVEFWWLADAKKPQQTGDGFMQYAGGMREQDLSEIHEFLTEQGALNG